MPKLSDSFRKFKERLQGKLLWEYWLAFKETFWEIFWGASVPTIVFGLYTLFRTPSLVLLLSYSLLIVFIAGYFMWAADHVRLQQKVCITKVREQKWTVGGRKGVGYYFEVVNKSEALTIQWIHVQLEKMIPEVENLDWLPVPLQQKHDNPPAGTAHKRDFNLNPSEHKHIDLVSAFHGDAYFTIHHIAGAGVNQTVPLAGRHRLRVMVTAKDTPVLFAWFEVWMNDEGVLQCEME